MRRPRQILWLGVAVLGAFPVAGFLVARATAATSARIASTRNIMPGPWWSHNQPANALAGSSASPVTVACAPNAAM